MNINTSIYINDSTYDIHTFKSYCALESIGKTTLGSEESLRMLPTTRRPRGRVHTRYRELSGLHGAHMDHKNTQESCTQDMNSALNYIYKRR